MSTYKITVINRTGKPNPRFPVADWTAPGLTRAHAGAWPLALDLFEEGHLSAPAGRRESRDTRHHLAGIMHGPVQKLECIRSLAEPGAGALDHMACA